MEDSLQVRVRFKPVLYYQKSTNFTVCTAFTSFLKTKTAFYWFYSMSTDPGEMCVAHLQTINQLCICNAVSRASEYFILRRKGKKKKKNLERDIEIWVQRYMVQLLLLLLLLLLLAHSFQIYCIKPIIVQYKLKHHLLHQILAQKYITLSPQRKKKAYKRRKRRGQKSSHSPMYMQVDGDISPPSWQSSNTWKNRGAGREKKKKKSQSRHFLNSHLRILHSKCLGKH